MRYITILILFAYSAILKLDSMKFDMAYEKLYLECSKTRGMIKNLIDHNSNRKNILDSLGQCKKSNAMVLGNYRNCISALGLEQEKSDRKGLISLFKQ